MFDLGLLGDEGVSSSSSEGLSAELLLRDEDESLEAREEDAYESCRWLWRTGEAPGGFSLGGAGLGGTPFGVGDSSSCPTLVIPRMPRGCCFLLLVTICNRRRR